MSRLGTIVLLAGLALALTAAPAHAIDKCTYTDWKSTGRGFWNRDIVDYKINTDSFPTYIPGLEGNPRYNHERLRNRIVSGGRTWSRLRTKCTKVKHGPPTLSFAYTGPTEDTATYQGDGKSTIQFMPQTNPGTPEEYLLNEERCPLPDTIGCTVVTHGGGVVTEVDIAFDSGTQWWTGINQVPFLRRDSSYDLWTFTAHEFGHAVGIAHPIRTVDANPDTDPLYMQLQMMYPVRDPGNQLHNLGRADIDGYCNHYCDPL